MNGKYWNRWNEFGPVQKPLQPPIRIVDNDGNPICGEKFETRGSANDFLNGFIEMVYDIRCDIDLAAFTQIKKQFRYEFYDCMGDK